MFSVIIPLYNKAPYIEKALQSVLQQTFRDFEIIVVDDGSTDNGAEIVKNIFSPHYLAARQLQIPLKGFQLISQPNQGVSTARNNGVKAAQENYLAFLDADDEWHPEYLAKMKQLIEQFPDAGLWASSYYIVKNGRNRLATVGVEKDFSKGIINYCQVYAKTLCMPVCTDTAIVPKKVFDEEHGFKPQLKLGEDFDLWVRIVMKHPVAFLNEPLAYYHQDVEQKNRGVVDNKIYEPATHYIFNLQFLEQAEKENTDLKQLLDNLRVYTLERYRLKKAYPEEVKKEISKVNLKNQPLKIRLFYYLPLPICQFFSSVRNKISKLKNKIRK
jgi:glycosyltransferase involved in cell wall biosynthesis